MIEILQVDNHKAGTDKIWILTNDISTNEVKDKEKDFGSDILIKFNKLVKLSSAKQDNKITSIDIRKNFILKISKVFFNNFPNLVHLNLSDNQLTKISDHFSEFKFLKSLRLDNNHIENLPQFIGKFERLEVLSLCGNLISKLPTSIQFLNNLLQFKISKNKIESLPIEFGLLKSLEILHIDCNYFIEIPTTLCYLKNLKELNFEWLEFTDPPYQKHLKDNIGNTIISFIKKSLQDLIKMGFLFCSFKLFVEVNSQGESSLDDKHTNKDSETNKIKTVMELKKKYEDKEKDKGRNLNNNKEDLNLDKTKETKDIYNTKENIGEAIEQDKKEYLDIEIKKLIPRSIITSNTYSNNICNTVPIPEKEDNIQEVKKMEFKDPQFVKDYEFIKEREKNENLNEDELTERKEIKTINKDEKANKNKLDNEKTQDQESIINSTQEKKNFEKANQNMHGNFIESGLILKRKKYLKVFYALENNMLGVVKVRILNFLLFIEFNCFR